MAGSFDNGRFALPVAIVALALCASGRTATGGESLTVGYLPYEPLCQKGADGRAAGLAIDVFEAIAADLQLSYEMRLIDASASIRSVEAKGFDVVIAPGAEAEWTAAYEPSVAYVSLPSGVFVQKKETRISSLASLRGRRVGVVENSPEARYALERDFRSDLRAFRNLTEALKALDRGECDAVICGLLVGAKIARDEGLQGIRANELMLSSVQTALHFHVVRSRPELTRAINDSLVRLYSTGKYDKIRQKWLGPTETKHFYLRDFLPYLLPVTALLFLLFAALAWQRQMLAKSYRELRASEFFYHSLVESLPQIIVRKDAEGRYTYANSGFAELVGKPIDQVVGSKDEDLMDSAAAEKSRAGDIQAVNTKRTLEYEHVVDPPEGKRRYLHVKKVPLFDHQNHSLGVQVLYWDVTVFRETEEQLRKAQKELIEASRRAGMAEVAVNVLHNIGNLLNSVNVASTTAMEQVLRLKFSVLGKIADLIQEHRGDLGSFFANDARAQRMPDVFPQIVNEFTVTREAALRELQVLRAGVDKIGEIVAAQQEYAQFAGVRELVSPKELMQHALGVCEGTLTKSGIRVVTDWNDAPPVEIERQKAVQVLVAILANAQDAMNQANPAQKEVCVSTRTSPSGLVQFCIRDNGIGIPAENLTRIYALGFTTKKDGRGFGLHSSSLAAKEMGGALHAASEGLGKGATFVLEIPPAPISPAARPSSDYSGHQS